MYGILKSGSHFLARQRIDHLNAHKAPHPLTADMDIVGGLYIVKPLILCKLRADAVGRHGLLCVIVAPSRIGFIDHLGAGFAGNHVTDSLNIVVDQALDLRGVPLITESGSSILVGYLGRHDNENTPYGAINVREHGFGRFVRAF